MAKKEDKKFIEEQIPVQDRPPFRPDQPGGFFAGKPKKLKPTSKFLQAKQKEAQRKKLQREIGQQESLFTKGGEFKQKPVLPKQMNFIQQDFMRSEAKRLRNIKQQVPTQQFKSSSSAKINTIPKDLKPTSKFLKTQKIQTQVLQQTPTQTSKKTGVFKLKEKPAEKFTSQQLRTREKLTPTQKRQVDIETQVAQITNPQGTKGFNKLQPNLTLSNKEARLLSNKIYQNPTGVAFDDKAVVVGSKVITTVAGGKAIVELAPALLPQEQQEKIETLSVPDELAIQKVIEEKQTISPDQISDLAVKTKIKPAIETEPERVKRVSTFDPAEISDLAVKTKPKPSEETLIGTQEDIELEEPDLEEVDLTDPNEEQEGELGDPVPLIEIDVVPEQDIEEEEVVETIPEPITEEELEEETKPEIIPPPEEIIEDEPPPPPDDDDPPPPPPPDDDDDDKRKEPPPPPPDDFGDVVVTPFEEKEDKPKKKAKGRPRRKIKFKKKPSKNQFKVKNGLKPTVTNFKTRKSSFQSNNVTGDIFKAPKGTEFDTNAGFREDSFKGIKFADKKLKFKNRKDVLVAAEKKGLI